MGEANKEAKLEGTPTWIVAVVCAVIICASLLFERFLHRLGKALVRMNKKSLFQALEKLKGELMLMGFISLLLVVSQGGIQKICIPESYTRHLRPCRGGDLSEAAADGNRKGSAAHVRSRFSGAPSAGRRLLADVGSDHVNGRQGKVPLLSIEAIHELHIFIFALATIHVLVSVKTVFLVRAKIHIWKKWEKSIHEEALGDDSNSSAHHHETKFIRDHFHGTGKDSLILSWVYSFFKQFHGSLTKSDYRALRSGFIMTHCKGNLKFDFHKYLVRCLEADYKKVVGISWYLWVLVVMLLLVNVGGWHGFFWLSFVPLILLLTVGTKLEHIIIELARAVAEQQSEKEEQVFVKPSDDIFWFHRPRLLLVFIHLILFLVAFESAYFFWILLTYGYSSCIMDRTKYAIPRLVISFVVRVFCSYKTLPQYALVSQMGSSLKPAVFEEHIKEGLIHWAQKAKTKGKKQKLAASKAEDTQLQSDVSHEDFLMEEGQTEIVQSNGSQICRES
ncbi:hypothetical protein HPP92_023441 [Vanilla planifolia]|uniref:MLO-like protein n=1 Tax=Vanilla planifolia TaxID=51239 RepID=A0A835UGJ2_VANPL|nr:hypothetical protein HPP92_023733 [Vanilla planifolia]KAG0460313.1 hypothetical protein HPP92_023441 [Vanilla planifolia]